MIISASEDIGLADPGALGITVALRGPDEKALGEKNFYIYPYDIQLGVAQQQYLPDELVGSEYYHPTTHGYGSRIKTALEQIRKLLGRN